MSYRHILAAIDYSKNCKSVLQKAIFLATQQQAILSVMHVVDNLPLSGTAYGTEIDLGADVANPLLELEKSLFIEELAEFNDIDMARNLVWGVPKQEIIHYADREAVDLILVGSHGRHGLELILGSTANAVLHHAHCDVLAVRISD
ncbi:MAG: universal stress protein A [Methyloprofundus sp.]|nr:MAG: universal stress protein A [Methyloprofundus sp.]